MTRRLLALFVALMPLPALAQSFTVTLDPGASDIPGFDADAMVSEMEGVVNSELKLDGQKKYLEQMANANAIATRGMGVDYATNFKKLVFGGSAGSGAAAAGLKLGSGDSLLPDFGWSAQMSLMAGLNLGLLAGKDSALNRVRIFGNGMAFKFPSSDGFQGSMVNYGAHLQVKIVGPLELKVVEWGGIDLTAGYEGSTYVQSLGAGFPIEAPIDGGTATWNADGSFDIISKSGSIPLEASTNLRVLVATAYVGGALDSNLAASSDSDIDIDGPLTAKIAGTKSDVGTARIKSTGSGFGSATTPRLFAGVQANILLLKIYGQANVGLNQSAGAHLGVRIAL